MEHDLMDTQVPARSSAAVSGAHSFLKTLVDFGVEVAFGIPGGAASPVFDALSHLPSLRYVATRHEAGAGFAALGHARATGRPALVLTTSGPGVTNALTAVASAQAEGIPMIVVAGEVPIRAWGRGALQDGTENGWRALDVLRPLTCWCGSVPSAAGASAFALQAYERATGARPGPVFVSVPLDVGSAAAQAMTPSWAPARVAQPLDARACTELAQALATASRPLMVLGAGARGASGAAVHLAERLNVPVVVTAHAKGVFPERHPLYLGVLGLGQHPTVDEYLSAPPDVSLVVASGLDDLATNGWTLPLRGTRASFQVDRDPLAMARGMTFSRGIVGDAVDVLKRVARDLPGDVGVRRRQVNGCRSHRPELERSDAVPLPPPRVLRALQDAFPSALWVSDIGEHLAYALHYLRIDDPESFHNFLGFGAMGSGVGAALGLQLGTPDRRVVCVCGDGGFSMMLGELLTCVEHELPVVFAVMNDGRWNMVEHGFQCVYGKVPRGFVTRVADFAQVARGFGADGFVIETPQDLDAIARTVRPSRPTVLDIRIDASQALTPGTRAASIRHFAAAVS